MAGQIYFFGSEFDSTNLVSTGNGDCSAANTLFLNDSTFLEIEYCEDGATYSMGKYRADDRLLSLSFDPVSVNEYFPETADTTNANLVNRRIVSPWKNHRQEYIKGRNLKV